MTGRAHTPDADVSENSPRSMLGPGIGRQNAHRSCKFRSRYTWFVNIVFQQLRISVLILWQHIFWWKLLTKSWHRVSYKRCRESQARNSQHIHWSQEKVFYPVISTQHMDNNETLINPIPVRVSEFCPSLMFLRVISKTTRNMLLKLSDFT